MADIRHTIPIAAPADRVYPLVATADGFAQWWAEDAAAAGDVVELGFFQRSTIYRLRAVSIEAVKKAEWICESGDEWSGTRIGFQVEESGTGSLVRFAHANWREASEYFTACNTTWGALMFRLKAAAEGKAPGPLFTREGWVA